MKIKTEGGHYIRSVKVVGCWCVQPIQMGFVSKTSDYLQLWMLCAVVVILGSSQ